MRSTIVMLLALALACGCGSAPAKSEPPPSPPPPEPRRDADAELEFKLVHKLASADFKGASLEAILSHIAEQTSCDFALDPSLCWVHGPAEFRTEGSRRLGDLLEHLQRCTPEIRIERWRGVVLVGKAGEPLLIPQTPLTGWEWRSCASRARLTVNLVHTPLEEVAGFVAHAFAYSAGSHYDRFDYQVDDSIKDRQVTASFHDLPLDHAIDVICRLADAKLVETYDEVGPIEGGAIIMGAVFTLKPREPVVPDEQPKRKP
jgi:hypothetical protein